MRVLLRRAGLRCYGRAAAALRRAGLSAAALRRYGGDLGTVAVGRGLTALGGVVGVRILTEAIPPAAFGRYKLALAALSLVAAVLVRPFVQYAMRAYHAADAAGAAAAFLRNSRRWLRRYVGLLSVAAAAGGYLLAAGGQPRLSLAELAGVVAILALQALVDFDRSLAVTRGRQRGAEVIGVAVQWSVPFAVAAAARFDRSLWTILHAHAVALALIVAVRRLRRPRSGSSAGSGAPADSHAGVLATARGSAAPADAHAGVLTTARAWPFAWPLMVAGCLGWLLHESDRFILSHYHGDLQVGLYAAAYALVSAPFTIVAGIAAQVMYPSVMAAGVRRGAASALPAPMLAATLLVGVGGVSVVWWWGDHLAALLLAESYRAGVSDLLVWIALGYACLGVSYSFDLAAHGAAKTRYMMISSAVSAAANVGLNLLLVPAGGAEAAAIATAAALVLYMVCMAALVARDARRGRASGD